MHLIYIVTLDEIEDNQVEDRYRLAASNLTCESESRANSHSSSSTSPPKSHTHVHYVKGLIALALYMAERKGT